MITKIDRCQRNSILQIIQIPLLLLLPPQPIQDFPIAITLAITITITPIPMISKNQSTGHLMKQKTTSENQ